MKKDNELFKGILIGMFGGTIIKKTSQAIRKYRLEKTMYEEVQTDTHDEK